MSKQKNMYTLEVKCVNSFLVEMSKMLLDKSILREQNKNSYNYLEAPVIIKIENPLLRIVTLPERCWRADLAYAESLWIASGRNDIDMVNHYSKNLKTFSDDEQYMPAGYGARLRFLSGCANQYTQDKSLEDSTIKKNCVSVDQINYVVQKLILEPHTRQALITIGDPAKDCFIGEKLKNSKDFPCTTSLHFLQNSKRKLDLIVHMRSNDFIWGASAVNIFNFTFIQEYVAHLVGLEIGNYYHIANNFHFYERHRAKVVSIARATINEEEPYQYRKNFKTIQDFNILIKELSLYEEMLRRGNVIAPSFEENFINDWAKIFYKKAHKNIDKNIEFTHPTLNKLTNKSFNK